MSEICIYLKAEPYLAEFLITAYGDPVGLERDSPESRILREYISKTPSGVTPDMGVDFNLAVKIPYFKEADPRVYNYLGEAAKKALLESFDQIVERSMMREIGALENSRRGKIAPAIYAWMEKHGITDNENNWYTVSQKYYRLRKKYLKHGLKV
jgi:hypothetical protein